MAFMRSEPVPKENLVRLSKEFKEADPLTIDMWIRLLITAHDVYRIMENRLSEHGLAQGRFSILINIYNSPGHKAKPIDIAKNMGVTRGNMTGVLATLEKENFIERETDPEDKRINYVCLTTRGKKHLVKMLPEYFKYHCGLSEVLSAKEKKQLIELLEKLRLRLKKEK